MLEISRNVAPLARDDRAGFDDLLGIFQRSIEVSEQKSAAEIAAIVANPRYCVLVLRVNGEVRGFAISYFPAGDFWLLEYLAVDTRLRSHGLGRTLFLAAKQAAEVRAPHTPCILEVDAPDANSPPTGTAVRRLRFYRALGCRRVEGLAYILPLSANGRPPPMTLLVHGLDGRDTLPKGQLARWLRTIYPDVYSRAADDPRIGEMITPLPDDIALISL